MKASYIKTESAYQPSILHDKFHSEALPGDPAPTIKEAKFRASVEIARRGQNRYKQQSRDNYGRFAGSGI